MLPATWLPRYGTPLPAVIGYWKNTSASPTKQEALLPIQTD